MYKRGGGLKLLHDMGPSIASPSIEGYWLAAATVFGGKGARLRTVVNHISVSVIDHVYL